MPVGRGKDIRKPEPVRRSTKGVAVSTAVMCCRILVVASTVASCTLLYWGSVCHTGCSGCCYGVLSHSTGSWHGCTLLLYKSGDKRNWQTRGPLPFTLKCIRYCDHHVILMLVRRFARSGVCARLMNCMCWNWPVVSKYMSCPRDGSVIYIYAQKNKSKASELLMYIHTYTLFSTKACTPCFAWEQLYMYRGHSAVHPTIWTSSCKAAGIHRQWYAKLLWQSPEALYSKKQQKEKNIIKLL